MATGSLSVFTSLVSEQIEQEFTIEEENELSLQLKSNKKKLKKFVRKSDWSITHPIRQNLWKDLCLWNKKIGPSVYVELANTGVETEEFGEYCVLPQFVDKDHLLYYRLNRRGQHTLHKIMFVIENAHPEITYCPLLLVFASALLHYVEETDCFECMMALLQEQTVKYLHQTRMEYEAFLLNFINLSAKFIPQTHAYLKDHTMSTEFFKNWIWIIFEALPFTHLVRIIDCFLVEGLKVLYRVGLAIVDSYRKNTGANKADNLLSSIQEFAKDIPESPNKLLKTAFQFRGFSKATIRSFQNKNQRKVCIDLPKLQNTQCLSHNVTIATELDSKVVSKIQLQVVWRWLPLRIALFKPNLIFSTSQHGYSLISLYNQCKDREPLLLLIKTIKKEVFGAYLSTNLDERNNKERKLTFFGTGECFLFSLMPNQEKYRWVGLEQNKTIDATNQMFIRAASNLLVIGGGDGDGIHLKSDIDNGWTSYCDTFGNPPLASTGQFQCAEVEVVSFVMDE